MATSADLKKSQDNGMEIRVITTGALVEYSPRYKGDRQPWARRENTTPYRYAAKECEAVAMADTITTEENDVNTQTGPLTARQTLILEDTMAGMTQKEIARKTGLPLTTIGRDNYFAARKFHAKKITDAVATYATAKAYRNAAAQVLSSRIQHPVDDTEDHVNHVLEGIAALFRGWSDQRMPR